MNARELFMNTKIGGIPAYLMGKGSGQPKPPPPVKTKVVGIWYMLTHKDDLDRSSLTVILPIDTKNPPSTIAELITWLGTAEYTKSFGNFYFAPDNVMQLCGKCAVIANKLQMWNFVTNNWITVNTDNYNLQITNNTSESDKVINFEIPTGTEKGNATLSKFLMPDQLFYPKANFQFQYFLSYCLWRNYTPAITMDAGGTVSKITYEVSTKDTVSITYNGKEVRLTSDEITNTVVNLK